MTCPYSSTIEVHLDGFNFNPRLIIAALPMLFDDLILMK